MCGIVGYINIGTEAYLRKSTEILKHRGPDAINYKWFKKFNSGLGHTRLSIIDLSHNADQPMYDPAKHNWIVYNGEIFNYVEIKNELKKLGYHFKTKSDTEVILKAYAEWGEQCLERFNGMFAFAIFNEVSGELFLARDRLGIKPLYYYKKGNSLIFASEIKAIVIYKKLNIVPDYEALYTPIHFQVTPRTGFKDILKLPAGYYLKFLDKKEEIIKYWDIYPTEEKISHKEAYETLDHLLQDAVKLQMVADVPIGALLSGGLDSSLISVLMQKKTGNPINSFTIKFKKDDLKRQGNVDDSFYAKKLAQKFNFNHHEIILNPNIVELLPKIVWHLEEPLADPAAINSFLIAREARKNNIKVLLSGMGADEVFGGYRAYLACLHAEIYQMIPHFIRNFIEIIVNMIPYTFKNHDLKYIRWMKEFLKIASLSESERAILVKNSALTAEVFNKYYNNPLLSWEETFYIKKHNELFNSYNNISFLTKMCYVDSKIYMTDHNLTYSDKAIMAASVEGRPPLIDHRIVEFMFKLPPNFRIKNSTQKYLLKKVAERYLPKEIIYRPKAPFSAPMRGWLRNELRDLIEEILSVKSLKNRGLYNYKYIRKLIEENYNGKQDHSQIIWRLMVNEIWFRHFF